MDLQLHLTPGLLDFEVATPLPSLHGRVRSSKSITYLQNILFIINGESERYKEDQYIRCDERLKNKKIVVYYESIKREINRRLIYECRRCDERLIVKTEGSTRLT